MPVIKYQLLNRTDKIRPIFMRGNFYTSKKWLRKREHILRRDKYIDQILKRYGKMREGNIVHHIFPRDQFPEYEFCDWNLITVSLATHNTLHDRNTNALTDEGMRLLIRTARKQGIENRIPETD